MLYSAVNAVVVIVDVQKKLMPAIRDADSVVAACVRLARIARMRDVPVIGTEQRPDALGDNVDDVKLLCERTITKDHFDACSDGLIDVLPEGRPSILVAGCEAHVCVLQTALGLLDHGFQVTMVGDAIGSRKRMDYEVALTRFQRAGGEVASVEMIAFEWMRTSRHPAFRDVLKLIK